jgi:hypothetical protein
VKKMSFSLVSRELDTVYQQEQEEEKEKILKN